MSGSARLVLLVQGLMSLALALAIGAAAWLGDLAGPFAPTDGGLSYLSAAAALGFGGGSLLGIGSRRWVEVRWLLRTLAGFNAAAAGAAWLVPWREGGRLVTWGALVVFGSLTAACLYLSFHIPMLDRRRGIDLREHW